MADQAAEGTETATNGVSSAAHFAEARAAFLAGDTADKPADKAEIEDDDSDLDSDADTDEEEAVDAVDEDASDDDEDDDSDLDEEDEDEDKADDGKKVDADTAKRLSQVQRTDKRIREQREKDFAARDRQFQADIAKFEAEWKPRIEAAQEFERARERVNADPITVLTKLGLKPEAYEHTAQILYTLAKSKDDPKAQAAVAKLIKDRELEERLERIEKGEKDREKTASEQAAEAERVRQGQALVASFVKGASDKTPLAKAFLKSDPTAAHADIARIAGELWDEKGDRPTAKEVMIAFEKDRRSLLRKMGLDPKKLSASEAAAALDQTTTTTKKKSDKKTEKPAEKSDGKKMSPRDAFIRGDKFD